MKETAAATAMNRKNTYTCITRDDPSQLYMLYKPSNYAYKQMRCSERRQCNNNKINDDTGDFDCDDNDGRPLFHVLYNMTRGGEAQFDGLEWRSPAMRPPSDKHRSRKDYCEGWFRLAVALVGEKSYPNTNYSGVEANTKMEVHTQSHRHTFTRDIRMHRRWVLYESPALHFWMKNQPIQWCVFVCFARLWGKKTHATPIWTKFASQLFDLCAEGWAHTQQCRWHSDAFNNNKYHTIVMIILVRV